MVWRNSFRHCSNSSSVRSMALTSSQLQTRHPAQFSRPVTGPTVQRPSVLLLLLPSVQSLNLHLTLTVTSRQVWISRRRTQTGTAFHLVSARNSWSLHRRCSAVCWSVHFPMVKPALSVSTPVAVLSMASRRTTDDKVSRRRSLSQQCWSLPVSLITLRMRFTCQMAVKPQCVYVMRLCDEGGAVDFNCRIKVCSSFKVISYLMCQVLMLLLFTSRSSL